MRAEALAAAYDHVYTAALIILAVMILLCLLRAILGPRVPDRIVAANMTGTMVMVMIAVLALKQDEGYLADICMIYAMTSFLAVIVLTKAFLGIYREQMQENEAAGLSGENAVVEGAAAHTEESEGGRQDA